MRPAFVKQITTLNSKIFRKVKPKRMNGRYLDGELLLELCRTYEQSINNGQIPNVESAWNFLCKSETIKAFREAEDCLDRKILELADNKCLSKDELSSLKAQVSPAPDPLTPCPDAGGSHQKI